MRQYFQYICKKVPFWRDSCMEVGGSDGGSSWQRHLDGVLSGVVIWNRLLTAGGWDGSAGEEERRAGGGQQWLDPLGWQMCYRSWDGVGVIIIIIIWCMGGDGVWCDEEWVLSVDPVVEMKSHAVSWSLMTWRAMSRWMDPMSGCYRIANDKSPASLRGSVKNI